MSMAVKTLIMLAILTIGIVLLSVLFIRDKRKMEKLERHNGDE